MARSFGFLLPFSLVLLATAAAGQEAGRAPLTPKPERTVLGPNHDATRLCVKFVHGSGVRLRAGDLVGQDPELAAIDRYLDELGARPARVFTQSEAWLDAWRASGEARSGRSLHDLNLFFHVELEPSASTDVVCDVLNSFEVVRIAWPLGCVEDPTVAVVAGTTPDFEGLQGYRRAAPLGIDADYGNSFSGGVGAGTLIADVETGWTDDHEDIRHKAEGNYIGLPGAPYPWDHGTAVLGELVGEHQGIGVKGMVYDADVLMSSHLGQFANVPTAIALAAAEVGPGDALVLEVQCADAPLAPHPCEYDDAIFATVQAATANGVHVFAAAGNGSHDLDDPSYGGKFDRDVRDSGAFIVGASNGASLDTASFSNHGSRVDAHGWGDEVTTAGYGDLHGGSVVTEGYTDHFGGTSSATPIVTAAGVILNGIHREAFGADMDPLRLRDLIVQTGTPQGAGGPIGPRPDVRAAIERMNAPRIDIAGDLAPGGSFEVTSRGPAGSLHVLFHGAALREEPLHLPPYGYLLLTAPLLRVSVGALDADGVAVYAGSVPPDAIPGTVLGYYQTWMRYAGGPGVGAFTNYVPWVVE